MFVAGPVTAPQFNCAIGQGRRKAPILQSCAAGFNFAVVQTFAPDNSTNANGARLNVHVRARVEALQPTSTTPGRAACSTSKASARSLPR